MLPCYPGQKKVYTSQKCFDKFGKFTNIDSSQILVWLRIFRTTLQERAKRAFCARQPLCRGEMDGWAMTAGLRHIQNSAVFPVLVGLFFILAVLRKKSPSILPDRATRCSFTRCLYRVWRSLAQWTPNRTLRNATRTTAVPRRATSDD